MASTISRLSSHWRRRDHRPTEPRNCSNKSLSPAIGGVPKQPSRGDLICALAMRQAEQGAGYSICPHSFKASAGWVLSAGMRLLDPLLGID